MIDNNEHFSLSLEDIKKDLENQKPKKSFLNKLKFWNKNDKELDQSYYESESLEPQEQVLEKAKVKESHRDTEDIKFVNALYSVANEDESSKVNILFYLILGVIVSLLLWANIAKIDELTSGEGKVIPSSKIQKVQYYDGGIISEILIKEGDHITQNQALMKIDTTRFKATFEETQESLYSLKAKQTRLEKELSIDYDGKLPKLKFKQEINEDGEEYAKNQKKIFKNKFYERKNRLKIIKLQHKQKQQELVELEAKKDELIDSLKLVKEELLTIERMVNSGAKSKVELINIKKEYNTLKGDLRATKLSIPRSKLAIDESKVQIEEKRQTYKSEISVELEETMGEIKIIEARFVSDNDKLDKTVIKSPVSGTIKQININTIGSVVQSGADLIEIVPDSDILLIEAKIDPKDIAFINPNLKALVKLTAYDFTVYGGLEGKIIEISADSIKDTDSKDNKSYYKVVVQTNKNFLEYNGEKLIIIPGMIASVDIVTGKKTIMDFFLKPIIKVKQGALHER